MLVGALAVACVAGCGSAPEAPAEAPAPAVRAAAEAPTTLAPRFERYSVTDGLASGFVRGVLQDRQGFLWIATADGLNRFDGGTFAEFYNDPHDPTSLSQNYTNRLLEDDLGGIWIGHSAGVDRFDPATERFAHYRAAAVDSASAESAPSVYGLAKDAAGIVWVGFRDGELDRFDPATDTRTRVSLHGEASGLSAIQSDPDGTLWLGGGSGLHRHDPATGMLTVVPLVPEGDAVPSVFALHRDHAGALWVGTWADGLFRLDPATGAARRFRADAADPNALGNPRVLTIAEDAAGTLWVGTDGGGLARYDPARSAFVRTTVDASDTSSLSGDRVTAIVEDRTGVLWVGTVTGLNRRLPLSGVVEQHRHHPDDPASLGSNDVKAFVEDGDGALWIATDGAGLSRHDSAAGTFTRADLDPDDPASMGDPALLALALDATGAVWAGGYSGLFRGAGGRFARIPIPNRDDAVGALAASPDGTLWIGAEDLLETDVRRPAVRLVAPWEPHGSVMTLASGPGGTVDVGTYGKGVYRLSRDGRVTTERRHDPDDERAISADIVSTLHRDRRGILWVGTNQGLNRIDERGGRSRVTHYSRAEGLPHSTVNGIADDEQGRIWVGTNRGLSRLDPATGAIRTYRATDGLQGDASKALYQSPRTGRIYVGGDGGYDAFDPAAIPAEAPPGPVVLTGLRLSDEPVRVGAEGSPLTRALSMTRALHLGPTDDAVTFQFAALDFGAPAQHRYAVHLEGLQDDWLDVGARREATFAALPPGRYTLRVRAAGRDGLWGEPSAPLSVVVAPPWWRAWWAYALYAFAALAAAALAVRYRREQRRLAQQAEADRLAAETLRDLDRSKSAFFANVSHEFRTPLTLTLGPLDDVLAGDYGPVPDDATGALSLARRSAGRVLDLINQILDLSRLEAGSTPLRARRLDLATFAEAQTDAFRPLAAHRRIAVTVSLPEAPVEVWADPEHVGTVLANVLSNAFKFTPEGGSVAVSVEAGGREARVAVADTGPGIAPEDLTRVFDRFYQVDRAGQGGGPLGSGIGLALAHDLAHLHGGTLTAASDAGRGSTFTLALPLGRAHLAPDQVHDDPWDGAVATAVGLPEAPRADTLDADEDAAADDVTTVLVADDNADIRAYVRRHLEAAGYRVAEAADGEDALASVRERLPDLVVSDVMMPRLDGLGLCRALRADPETDFVPILLLTAKASPEDRLGGLAEACDDYLTKPFDVRELVARVDNLIGLRRRLRERFATDTAGASTGDGAATEAQVGAPAGSADSAFVAAVRAAIEARLEDDTFSVLALAEAVGHSRSQLLRRTRVLLDTSPSEMLRTARLDRAKALLEARAGTVGEVAYAVGFKSVAHFSNAFLEHTGARPSAYAQEGAGR